MGLFSIQMDRPAALLLALLIIPVIWIGWRSLTGMSTTRRSVVCGVRAIVIFAIAFALTEPKWRETSDSVSVVLLVDRSRSIRADLEAQAIAYLRAASEDAEDRRPIDRLAVINIGGEARVQNMPHEKTVLVDGVPLVPLDATNLAEGIRLGLAIAPQDSANRFVLASDGNENTGNVMAAAELAQANNIPIDVLRLQYAYESEVLVERVVAPAQVRQGQNFGARVLLRATRPTAGTLSLTLNGEPLDINPDSDDLGRPLTLQAGTNTENISLMLDEADIYRLAAFFTPADPAEDGIIENNSAEAVIVVGGEGRVLLVHPTPTETDSLVQALIDAEIEVTRRMPDEVPANLLQLSAFDSIVLANVPAHLIPEPTQEALRRFVHDTGGGLIMLGGPESFGAGGWIDTPVEEALPVRLDPPSKKQMPRGALVCIMHSCEIPAGNHWGVQCAIAAVNALSSRDLVGVIDFDWNPNAAGGGLEGCNWVVPFGELRDKQAAIAAINGMTMGDMPDFRPAMQMALDQLSGARAGQKHVLIISDGDPTPPSATLLNDFVNNRITISTVLSGGHGSPQDATNMRRIAEVTGGRFYDPGNNWSLMPQIFIKEATVVKRSLIVEGDTYLPVDLGAAGPGPFRSQFPQLPPIDGYVLTHPRDGQPAQIVTSAQDGTDPILAYWQYGLGKSVAYTSDATNRWGASWVAWQQYQQFWEQVVRWSMRPAAPANLDLRTRVDGRRAIVEVESVDAEGRFSFGGTVAGLVIAPNMESQPLRLEQVGPGRWRGEFDADQTGAWVVNIVREEADGRRAATQTGFSVAYSQEFLALRDNAALLDTLAQRTGGRVLPSDPLQAGLFEREALEPVERLSTIWTLIAMLAATLFVADVATRRLAISPVEMAHKFLAFFGAERRQSAEAMGRLKEVRTATQGRMPDRVADDPYGEEAQFGAGQTWEPPAGGAGIDLADELSGEAGAAAGGQARGGGGAGDRRPEPGAGLAAEGADAAERTSRLLAAKRRAREHQQDGEGGSAGQDRNADGGRGGA